MSSLLVAGFVASAVALVSLIAFVVVEFKERGR